VPAAPVIAPPQSPEPGAAAQPPADVPPDENGSTMGVAGLVIAGTGVAAMGVGVALGVVAKGKHEESDPHCIDDLCNPEGLGIRDSARTTGTIATAVFVGGGAALVGGGLMWLLAPDDDANAGLERAGLRFGASPQGVGFSYGGTW